ncbi:MAG: hypothetical protein ACLS43_04640 [Evtepia gabavorous]
MREPAPIGKTRKAPTEGDDDGTRKRKEPAGGPSSPAESPSQPPLSEGEVEHPPEKEPYRPYSRSTRIKAWIGIAFMVFLVIMYTYAFASGKIMAF